MYDTSDIDQRQMFGPDFIGMIIFERYDVSLDKAKSKDLHKFIQYYWESVKGYGRYLKDIDFGELSADAKEDIVCRAFYLWRNYHVETGKMVK